MLIQDPEPKTHKVHDMEFTFTNGHAMNLTVDEEAGDEVLMDGPLKTIIINLVSKLSQDELFTFPAETVTIMRDHIVTIKRTERSVTEPTKTQKEEWRTTFQEMATRTIQ